MYTISVRDPFKTELLTSSCFTTQPHGTAIVKTTLMVVRLTTGLKVSE